MQAAVRTNTAAKLEGGQENTVSQKDRRENKWGSEKIRQKRRQLIETQKNRQSTNTDLRKDVETVEDTYKDGEKKSKPQIWCAVAPAGWMGCWRRGQIKQNSTFDSKTVLKIHPFSFCSHTYHTYSHLLGYTAWRTSFCFPAHFKGLYFTSMHLVFLCFWLQSSLMKSDSVTTFTYRAGEEENIACAESQGLWELQWLWHHRQQIQKFLTQQLFGYPVLFLFSQSCSLRGKACGPKIWANSGSSQQPSLSCMPGQ